MGRKPSLETQVIQLLNSKKAFGESKHNAKKEKIKELKEKKFAELRAKGIEKPITDIRIPAKDISLEKIYSYKSFETYKQKSIQFTNWVKECHPETKFIRDTHGLAAEYLQSLVDRGLAPTSVSGHGSALAKLFGKPAESFGFEFPIKHQNEVSKGRSSQPWDAAIDKKYGEELAILSITGLRRKEAVGLKISQISPDFTKIYDVKGKNGKLRTVDVLDPGRLKNYIQKHSQDEKLFKQLPKRMNTQRERRNYVQMFYQREIQKIFPDLKSINYREKDKGGKMLWYLTRGTQVSEKYYKPLLARISQNLGHNRLDVVVKNYLK